MFINIRLSKLFKIFFVFVVILMILFFGISIFKIFLKSHNNKSLGYSDEIIEITSKNYTNVLKEVHDNIDKYLNKNIKFTGYIYRVYDLTDTQFVLARNMIISPDFKSVVVGFLCDYEKASEFKNDTWVEITGTITKGNYHGDMPIIKIKEINTVECPNDEFVYPPDNSFIPTTSII